jgi:hypothetical protein
MKLGAAADRLARLLVSETEPAKHALRKLAETDLTKRGAKASPRAFKLVNGRTWKEEQPDAA